MSEQNLYRIEYELRGMGWWPGGLEFGDTWKDAIHNWIEEQQEDSGASYKVISETTSEDGWDGIMRIKESSLPSDVLSISKVRAVIRVAS